MEKQIIDAQERYSRLLKLLTDYIYTVKVEDGIAVETYHGPGCLAVTGYMSEDFDANTELWYSMVHEDDKEKVLQQAKDALSGKDMPPLEHRIYHRDGKLKWVKNSIVLSRNDEGKLLYYDGLINDITERKIAEELTEIKQKQLIQADKMISIGTLTTGIAHEINNPNNFILINVSVLSRVWNDIQPILNEYYNENGDFLLGGMVYSNSAEKIKNSIDGIFKGAVRIQKITQGLTNFAKKEDDEFTYDYDTDINEVIENAIMLTASLIKKSTVNFIVNYNKEIPKIKGNLQQLEQVIINLITNACHALTDTSNKIEIITNYNSDKKIVTIDVEDEGKGIEQEKLKHIFDPFYTTKREEGGTGLGLYISYNIIKRHGGELKVNSEIGKKTIFSVILPIL